MTNLAQNFGEGEASVKLIQKYSFSQFSCQFYGKEGKIGHQKSVKGGS